MLAIIGAAMVLTAAVAVKLFDDEIRKAQWRKAVINFAVIAGIILFIIGIIITIFVR